MQLISDIHRSICMPNEDTQRRRLFLERNFNRYYRFHLSKVALTLSESKSQNAGIYWLARGQNDAAVF